MRIKPPRVGYATASALPPGALMVIAVWCTTFTFVVATLAAATRIGQRRARRRLECRVQARTLGLKPGVLSGDVAAAYVRLIAAEFERDIAALHELEYVPDDWLP